MIHSGSFHLDFSHLSYVLPPPSFSEIHFSWCSVPDVPNLSTGTVFAPQEEDRRRSAYRHARTQFLIVRRAGRPIPTHLGLARSVRARTLQRRFQSVVYLCFKCSDARASSAAIVVVAVVGRNSPSMAKAKTSPGGDYKVFFFGADVSDRKSHGDG